MKKITTYVLLILLLPFVLVGQPQKVSANQGLSIFVNGDYQSYSGLAKMEKGRTLVPLRGIFESLHATVQYDAKQNTIHASKGKTKVWLKIGSKQAKVNGKTVKLDVPAKIVKGKTIVPLRFIGEALGADVEWVAKYKTIYISNYTKGIVSDPTYFDLYDDRYGNTTLEWYAKNTSGKRIHYYTVYLSTYNPVGDPSYDRYTGDSQFILPYVGPISPGESLGIVDTFTTQLALDKVMIDKIEFQFSDGTKATQWYGHWIAW